MDDGTKKKNILDLQFQKYLIVASTSVIIAFTYVIGLGIAVLSKQIRLDDFNIMGAIFVISAGVLGICSIIFFNAVFHLKNIPLVVKNL
ncbi:MAG: hypothetical protein AABW91_03980 [Nanoarchaeota archaeon]